MYCWLEIGFLLYHKWMRARWLCDHNPEYHLTRLSVADWVETVFNIMFSIFGASFIPAFCSNWIVCFTHIGQLFLIGLPYGSRSEIILFFAIILDLFCKKPKPRIKFSCSSFFFLKSNSSIEKCVSPSLCIHNRLSYKTAVT